MCVYSQTADNNGAYGLVVVVMVVGSVRAFYTKGRSRLHIINGEKSLANDFMFESTLNCDGRIHKYVTTFSL